MKTHAERPAQPAGEFTSLSAAVHPAWHQAIIRLANASERVAFRLEAFMGTPIDRGMARHARELVKDLIDFLDNLEDDPDLEPTAGGTCDDECEPPEDAEPSLGALGGFQQDHAWANAGISNRLGEDLEEEHDGREPDSDLEPSRCGIGACEGGQDNDLEGDDADREPIATEPGALAAARQRRRKPGARLGTVEVAQTYAGPKRLVNVPKAVLPRFKGRMNRREVRI